VCLRRGPDRRHVFVGQRANHRQPRRWRALICWRCCLLIATDRRGVEIRRRKIPFMRIPILNWHAGNRLTVFYQRQW
jgi:hypothetical protein